jgi:hypothetical protein
MLSAVSSRQRTLIEEVRISLFYLFKYGMRGLSGGAARRAARDTK